MQVKFKQWDCITKGMYYASGARAIHLIDENTGEPIATATVNIVGEKIKDSQVFVKDYSENEGMTKALIEAGIIEKNPVLTVRTGYVKATAYNLTQVALDEIWPE